MLHRQQCVHFKCKIEETVSHRKEEEASKSLNIIVILSGFVLRD